MTNSATQSDGPPHSPGRNGAESWKSFSDGDPAALRMALTRVTHDINNPLTIISGNAQLLLELSRMLDLAPDLAKPIQDIEEASQRLALQIERLNELKEKAEGHECIGAQKARRD